MNVEIPFKKNKTLQKLWFNLHERCNNPKNVNYLYYGNKGIKMKLTKIEIKHLWERDNAKLMHQPSIDRINPKENYELKNCRFIEMHENRKRRFGDNYQAISHGIYMNIDKDLKIALRIKAIKNNTTIRDLITLWIRKYLNSGK